MNPKIQCAFVVGITLLTACGVEKPLQPTSGAVPWNASITYDTLTDTRDGHKYRTVAIGSQVWMAENLNFVPDSGLSWCYANQASKCVTYGRLYTWATAMTYSASTNSSIKYVSGDVQGICPSQWHVPSAEEWSELFWVVDSTQAFQGQLLKSSGGWVAYSGAGNGTDAFGFRVLPGGERVYREDQFEMLGAHAAFLSASQVGPDDTQGVRMGYIENELDVTLIIKSEGMSVRCLHD